MTGILDRIRNTTVDDLLKVTGDFSDAPAPVYRPRVEREMIRVVEGADDLKPTMPTINNSGGMVRTDGSGKIDHRPFKDDQRSEGQIRYMDNLISWITEKDADLGAQARDWTDKMTAHGKWVAGRDTNVSRWIDSLKAKNAELNAAARIAPKATNEPKADSDADVPDGYYAIEIDDTTKFYRLRTAGKNSRYPGRRYLKVQASDEFHPIRSTATRNAVLAMIRKAGIDDARRAYGRLIGSCGRCGRTLTDETSRARGIGPDCEGHM
jgi:hypothetical protein